MQELDTVVKLLSEQFKMTNEKIDRSDETVNAKIDALTEMFHAHVQKDEEYWRIMEQRHGQLRLLQWLAGTGVGSSLMLWLQSLKH